VRKGNLVILHACMIDCVLTIFYYEVWVDYYYLMLLEFGKDFFFLGNYIGIDFINLLSFKDKFV
jgi:hypothetical protein